LVVESREVPHETIVDEVLAAVRGKLGLPPAAAGGDA
jgi:hypothetical protein